MVRSGLTPLHLLLLHHALAHHLVDRRLREGRGNRLSMPVTIPIIWDEVLVSLRYNRETLARPSRASFGARPLAKEDPTRLRCPRSSPAPVPRCRARATLPIMRRSSTPKRGKTTSDNRKQTAPPLAAPFRKWITEYRHRYTMLPAFDELFAYGVFHSFSLICTSLEGSPTDQNPSCHEPCSLLR